MWKKAAPSLTITLPSPCGEDWHLMSPVDQGRYCKACDKVVIDFTRMSDEEIIDFFQASPNTCGRFKESSLNRKLIKAPTTQRFLHLPRLVWGMMLGMALSMRQELNAQNQTKQTPTEQIQTNEKLPIHGGDIQIRGIVRDSISGDPISGASI